MGMRLEEVTAEIRPRSDWEAVDLGLALVRRDFWRCWCVWWLALSPVWVVGGWWLWDAPLAWLALLWWFKPVGSRLVLHELSRRLFGERPTWRDSLREIPRAWWRRFWYRLVVARLSPWLPVAIAVEDLEGLRGRDFRRRCGQVTRRGQGVVLSLYLIADVAAFWFGLAILLLVGMLIPEGQDSAWQLAVDSWDPLVPYEIPGLIARTVAVCVAVAMALTDVFFTGAGFGIYLNNRTWLEGWDVELALKRLAGRLAGPLVVALVCVVTVSGGLAGARTVVDPLPAAEVVREVKAHPDFKVHTVKERVPRQREVEWKWPGWLRFLGGLRWLLDGMVVAAIGLLAAGIVWLLWTYRGFFSGRGLDAVEVVPPRARVVMGLDVSPESLPADVPGEVLRLWRDGHGHAALALLYRACIGRIIEAGTVAIQESLTEGECLERVSRAGVSCTGYFRSVTRAWMGMAYAGVMPCADEIESLCRSWPFVEGGQA